MPCEFDLKLAGSMIHVQALYESTKLFCKGYVVERPEEEADFSVEITEELLEQEQKQSDRERINEGETPYTVSGRYLETLALYRQIAEKILAYDTFLFHGSAVAVEGEAYLFTAPSGTGKSTHSKLWRDHFGEQAVMVNDDKPLIRIVKDQVLVCGTPWSGKENLDTDIQVPLKAICLLTRDSDNRLVELTREEAYPALLSQTYRPKDPELFIRTLDLLDVVLENTKQYRLFCNNYKEDAFTVSYEGLKNG